MSSKITIIGAGSVGATIAYTLSNEDIASNIVLIDINKQKVEGEVMDIAQGTCFRDPISIVAGEYEDAKGSDIVIITSGIARKPGQTRIELTQTNVNIMKSIAPQIVKAAPDALYIIVSNPVDIMTYVFTKISGLPENQIIGSGTILDTARLRCGLSEHFKVSQKNIHAYVFGEHGDSSMIPWSLSSIDGMKFDDYCAHIDNLGDKDAIEQEVRAGGAEVIKCKGATYYAIALSVSQIAEAILRDTKMILTVSTLQDGSRYGVKDVCLSLPCVVGANGIEREITPPLLPEEEEAVRKSAAALREVIDAMKAE